MPFHTKQHTHNNSTIDCLNKCTCFYQKPRHLGIINIRCFKCSEYCLSYHLRSIILAFESFKNKPFQMIFKWFFVIIAHLITNFSLSFRVTATFQSSQTNSKIDTSSQDKLPRTAPELKCSFASSTKPILQPPQVVKLRYEQYN